MNHVMLDLETLGTGPDAAIVAIGAVAFDPRSYTLGDTFYRVIDLESALRWSGTVDGSTLKWWLSQPDAARRELARDDATDFPDTLEGFSTWCSTLCPRDDLRVWGNGAGFDNTILRQSYLRVFGVLDEPSLPWIHWNDRCYRTVKAFYPHIPKPAPAIKHHALEDARAQAQHLLAMLAAKPVITDTDP